MDRGIKKINEKVIKIMQVMAEHNYVNLESAKGFIPSKKDETKERIAARYLRFLKEQKFSKIMRVPLANWCLHYLTGKGWGRLRYEHRLRLKNRFSIDKLPALRNIQHTLKVIEVRAVVERDPCVVDFKPEKVLGHEFWQKRGEVRKGKSCDAEITWQHKKRYALGLEVQLSKKSKDTYERYMRRLRERTELSVILWVCASKNIILGLQRATKKEPSLQAHRFCLLDDLKKNGLRNARWYNKDGEVVALVEGE